jgi:segregation and condensation protein B
MTHGEEASRGNDLALVEAALFLASRPLTRRALAKILGDVPLTYVDQLLGDLQGTYADEATGIELMLEEGRALLRVKSAYVDRVAHLAPQQDIPQPVLRTLAVIAYNHPATQADVVRTRGNKAYEHIQELIERGLIRGEDHGRTILLHVTDEFLRHFGLSTIDEFRFHVAAPPDEAREPAPELALESEPASETQEVHDG